MPPPFSVEADIISVPGLIRIRLRCAQNVRRSMLIHCTDPFEQLLVPLSIFSSSLPLRQVRRFSERKRQACWTCSKLVPSNLPRTSRLRGAHASSGRSSSPRSLRKDALLRLKAVLWRGLCNGQQRCRLWPPVGRAHFDSEEGEDQAGETHESSRRCQDRVRHRPSLALSSRTSRVLGLSGRTLRGRFLRELSLKRGFEKTSSIQTKEGSPPETVLNIRS